MINTVFMEDVTTFAARDEDKVIRIAKCDVFSGVCESNR